MRLRFITIALLVLGFVFSGTSLTAQAQWWRWIRPKSQSSLIVLADSRRIDWTSAGATITNRTTPCGSTIAAYSGTADVINVAIAACASGQVVTLGAGTFTLSSGILFNAKSNVTLRGAGGDQTLLIFTGRETCHGLFASICLASADTNYKSAPSNLADWTANYTRGATSITLSQTPSLSVGDPLTLDQLDDAVDDGNLYVCSSGACVTSGDGGGPRPGRAQQQIVTVTAINGLQVTITPGLYMPNWRAGQSPQAWWPSNPIAADGVEDLSADHTSSSSSAGFALFNCTGCWVKGVRSIKPGRSHVLIQQSHHATVRDSYFYDTTDSGVTSYGIETFPSADTLLENNVFHKVTAPLMLSGSCEGCVLASNYSINNIYTPSDAWQSHLAFLHAGGSDYVLFEGNIGVGIYSDTFHGTHHFMTAFRNYFSGYMFNNGTPTTSNTIPLRLDAFSRFFNIIGNVLGSTTRPHNNYETGNAQSIYVLGDPNGAAAGADANVARTLMRWGNYDVVTGAARFNSAEVPSGIATYPNPLPSRQELPPSFYRSTKPSFFHEGTPWPPIGPDVSGGSVANVGGHVYKIPAQSCYELMGGAVDGTSGVLTFNAATCY